MNERHAHSMAPREMERNSYDIYSTLCRARPGTSVRFRWDYSSLAICEKESKGDCRFGHHPHDRPGLLKVHRRRLNSARKSANQPSDNPDPPMRGAGRSGSHQLQLKRKSASTPQTRVATRRYIESIIRYKAHGLQPVGRLGTLTRGASEGQRFTSLALRVSMVTARCQCSSSLLRRRNHANISRNPRGRSGTAP
jgi:hypothetical protein